MSPKNADKGKRKKIEIGESSKPPSEVPSLQFDLQAAQVFPSYPSTALRLDLNNFERQNAVDFRTFLSPVPLNLQLMNTTTLAEDGGSNSNALAAIIKENNDQIAQAIIANGEQLKRTLTEMQHRQYTSLFHAAEEKTSQKLKQKNLELRKLSHKIGEMEENQARMRIELQLCKFTTRQMEAKVSALQSALQDAMIRGARIEGVGCSEALRQEPDRESSHVDPNRVEPVRMGCRVCGNRVTTMMLWQCRHVCMCKRCDEITKNCPICQSIKTSSFEVFLE